jgi:KDEL-tailed cysteine endopeptidase
MKGPVAVIVDASSDLFRFYHSGVLTNSSACGTEMNHQVTIVGFSLNNGTTPYYIAKNSWGADWGHDGYIYIGIEDGEGVCGI